MTTRTAVITGAASGIGLACARRFAAEGYRVALVDLPGDRLDAATRDVSTAGEADAIAIAADVSDAAEVQRMADNAHTHFENIDVLMNNAGVAPSASVVDAPPDVWQWVNAVNVLSVAYGIGAFAPAMRARGRGHIINTGSEAGLITGAFLGAYAATKHAVIGMSESAFRELEPHGVAVSVVCPGLVGTNIANAEQYRPERFGTADDSARPNPMGQGAAAFGISPDEVAECVLNAVESRDFWVFTHAETKQRALTRFEDLSAERNPTPAYNFG